MGMEDYRRALKEGKREYQLRMQMGQTPTLKSLDSILPQSEILGQEPLGLVSIPIERIAGTKYEGRCFSFASNFMPIMDGDIYILWTYVVIQLVLYNYFLRNSSLFIQRTNFYVKGRVLCLVRKIFVKVDWPQKYLLW